MRHALSLLVALTACGESPFAQPPRERPEEVLARIEARGPTEELAGRWKLVVPASERAQWDAWADPSGRATLSEQSAGELRAAVARIDRMRMEIEGTSLRLIDGDNVDAASFLVEASTRDAAGRLTVDLIVRRPDGSEDRLSMVQSDRDELTVHRSGRSEPPTVWRQDRSSPEGAP